MENHIITLLGLKEVIVKNITETAEEVCLDIELPRRAHTCPACGLLTDRIHDYRTQIVHDLDAFDKRTTLRLRKRRYLCPNCGKRFAEANDFLPRYYRRTRREILHILQGLRGEGVH